MVAVYDPALVVYSDEKPGSRPMVETIMRKSPDWTILRIRSSTLATYCSVTSIRVPVGAFTLMVNWPASVRGKEGHAEQWINRQAGQERTQQNRHREAGAAESPGGRCVHSYRAGA